MDSERQCRGELLDFRRHGGDAGVHPRRRNADDRAAREHHMYDAGRDGSLYARRDCSDRDLTTIHLSDLRHAQRHSKGTRLQEGLRAERGRERRIWAGCRGPDGDAADCAGRRALCRAADRHDHGTGGRDAALHDERRGSRRQRHARAHERSGGHRHRADPESARMADRIHAKRSAPRGLRHHRRDCRGPSAQPRAEGERRRCRVGPRHARSARGASAGAGSATAPRRRTPRQSRLRG